VQLQDHRAGRRLLDEEERASLEKRIDVFARKIETMRGDLDDREVERILMREQIRDERVRERLQEKRGRDQRRRQHAEL